MSTILNKEINTYRDLYSQLVDQLASAHNAHLAFLASPGRDNGYRVRKHLKLLEDISKKLRKQNMSAYKEKRINDLARIAERKAKKGKRNGNNN